jgi:hypothetical protein
MVLTPRPKICAACGIDTKSGVISMRLTLDAYIFTSFAVPIGRWAVE